MAKKVRGRLTGNRESESPAGSREGNVAVPPKSPLDGLAEVSPAIFVSSKGILPETANDAVGYMENGSWEKAKQILQGCATCRHRKNEQQKALDIQPWLAGVLFVLGEDEEAETLCEDTEALANNLGMEAPQQAELFERPARKLSDLGKHDAAAALNKKARELLLRVLSVSRDQTTDPDTLKWYSELAFFEEAQNELMGEYAGKYVAVKDRQVVDSDADSDSLMDRLEEAFPDDVVFVAKVGGAFPRAELGSPEFRP